MGLAIRHVFPKFGELWSGVPRYHIATCNSPSLMHLLLHATKVLFLALSDFSVCFFVCHANISRTAEQIFAKITGKTLVPRLDEFRMSRSKVKVIGTKTCLALLSAPVSVWMACAHCKQCAVAADSTIPSLPGEGVVISGLACSLFGKTSLAVVFTVLLFS